MRNYKLNLFNISISNILFIIVKYGYIEFIFNEFMFVGKLFYFIYF